MDIIAPVTDYMSGSVLTTRGDVLQRGVTVAERLALGSVGDALVVNGAGTDVEWDNPNIAMLTNRLTVRNTGMLTLDASELLLTLDLGTLTLNSIYLAEFLVTLGNSANDCYTEMRLQKTSGTGVVNFLYDLTTHKSRYYVEANKTSSHVISTTFKVVTAGTYIINVTGSSNPDFKSISIGYAQMSITPLYIA